MSEEAIAAARRRIRGARGVVVLTGAGVSAESGVPTFRGGDGLWARYRVEELATPEAFARDARLVWEWYDMRRRRIMECAPNAAHRAIARLLLEREDATLVSQNVDGLHGRAIEDEGGTLPHPRLLELHGTLFRVRCAGSRCTYRIVHREPVDSGSVATLPRCPECGGRLRPDVVWFGEMLPEETLELAFRRASEADVCIVAGTSALVHPAASVPLATLRAGGDLIEVNPEVTPLSVSARWCFRMGAGELLPRLLEAERT
jgi:NAD-dependent deacetylase